MALLRGTSTARSPSVQHSDAGLPLPGALLHRAAGFAYGILGFAQDLLACSPGLSSRSVGGRAGFALDAALQLFRLALDSLCTVAHVFLLPLDCEMLHPPDYPPPGPRTPDSVIPLNCPTGTVPARSECYFRPIGKT
jgi:hypothetical protein